MWYKTLPVGSLNQHAMYTKHACHGRTDGHTDRITTPKTALAQLHRVVKMLDGIAILRTQGLLLLTKQRGLSFDLSVTVVSPAKMAEPTEMTLGIWTRVGPRKYVLHEAAHWHHLANTTEPSMCGSDAACCQITLTTCYNYYASAP